MKADSTESALNKGLRDLPLLISTYIFAVITARKTNHIQASWAIAESCRPDWHRLLHKALSLQPNNGPIGKITDF